MESGAPQVLERRVADADKGMTPTTRFLRALAWVLPLIGCLAAALVERAAGYVTAVWAWQAVVLVLPFLAFAWGALRIWPNQPLRAPLAGLAGSGLVSFCCFWAWWFSPGMGRAFGALLFVASLACVIWLGNTMPSSCRVQGRKLLSMTLAWISGAYFVVCFSIYPIGSDNAVRKIQCRFSHALPIDNALPLIFAEQLMTGKVERPMIEKWLSSDRPPLQTGSYLTSQFFSFPDRELHYQIHGVLLQLLWIVGLLTLLQACGISPRVQFLTLIATSLSALAIVHGAFVWPKLLPVAYLLGVVALLLKGKQDRSWSWVDGALLGALAALANLAHGGTAFALLGLGLYALCHRVLPGRGFLLGAIASCVVVTVPWTCYQRFVDPPGNRLLKWHLAGVVPIDQRGVGESIWQSYRELDATQIVENKLNNFQALFRALTHGYAGWVPALLRTTVGLGTPADYETVRLAQFYVLAANVAWMLPGLLLLGFRRPAQHVQDRIQARQMLYISLWICLVWCLLMFIPGETVVHQGSLLPPMLLSVAGMIGYCSISPLLGWLAFFLNGAVFWRVYVVYSLEVFRANWLRYPVPLHGSAVVFSVPLQLGVISAALLAGVSLWFASAAPSDDRAPSPA